ncbi:hypothetical protein [Pseudidiomarina salilacus]
MANNEEFRDSSGSLMGVLAVLVVLAVPVLPATLQWIKNLTA